MEYNTMVSGWKKLFKLNMIVCIVVLVFSAQVHAADITTTEASLDYIYGRELTEEEITEIREAVEPFAGSSGYLPDEEEEGVQSLNSYNTLFFSEIPESYDARNEGIRTLVDTQRYGDCWAFATLNLMEMNAMRTGLLQTADLSERHLVYYSFHSVVGTPGQQTEESTTYRDGGSAASCFRNGGRFDYAIRTLSSYVGAVPETAAPYEDAAVALPLSADDVYHGAMLRLKNAFIISSADRSLMKESIMEYGAVGITYYSGLTYYNYNTAAQYCPYDTVEDHAVVIVGWDDSYSKNNFTIPPENDGAWLVKNNWGSIFGDDGYFWLSYEDASIAAKVYVVEAEAVDRYDTIYQCDNTLLDGKEMAEGKMTVANRYTMSAEEGKSEYLEAVSITLPVGGMEYEIQLYKDSEAENPEAGEALLAEGITGYIPYAGTWTIEFPTKIEAEYSADISIVIKLTGEKVGIMTDVTRTSGRTVCQSTGGIHTSYLLENGIWKDYGQEEQRNFRIKLFTTEGNRQEISVEPQDEEDILAIYQEYLDSMQENVEIELLYNRLLHRDGEAAGKSYWQEKKQQGYENAEIFAGFIYSVEYGNLHPEMEEYRDDIILCCLEMEIQTEISAIDDLYETILQREYDLPGLIYWAKRKAAGETISEIESLFYLSEEYILMN